MIDFEEHPIGQKRSTIRIRVLGPVIFSFVIAAGIAIFVLPLVVGRTYDGNGVSTILTTIDAALYNYQQQTGSMPGRVEDLLPFIESGFRGAKCTIQPCRGNDDLLRIDYDSKMFRVQIRYLDPRNKREHFHVRLVDSDTCDELPEW